MENLAYNYMADDFVEDEEPDYEIIEGEKIYMSPTPNAEHGSIVGNVVTIFNSYCWPMRKARVFGDNIDVHLPDGNTFRPDVSVICDLSIIKFHDTIYGVPDLVVEILSRSTMMNDIGKKKDIYEKNGVKEYWIINHWIKVIEVYHLIDGKFKLDYVYQIYSDIDWQRLTEEQRKAAKFEIKVSIFDDLMVDINKVFMWID
ncbi:MAG: Uma2 family endonuclease [Selenomonadaceae bacterium]|nr:Uma2 family endonuclease [Selenomonadaceae bacterium]